MKDKIRDQYHQKYPNISDETLNLLVLLHGGKATLPPPRMEEAETDNELGEKLAEDFEGTLDEIDRKYGRAKRHEKEKIRREI